MANSQRAKWNTANARKANSLLDGFRGSQEIADVLRPYTPVIQWGAVSQKWHVTFLDWTDEIYTGDTILMALEAAEQGVQRTAATPTHPQIVSNGSGSRKSRRQ